jgi:hypothetical protein
MALMPLSIICAWRAAEHVVHLLATVSGRWRGVEQIKVAAQVAKRHDASVVAVCFEEGGRGVAA